MPKQDKKDFNKKRQHYPSNIGEVAYRMTRKDKQVLFSSNKALFVGGNRTIITNGMA